MKTYRLEVVDDDSGEVIRVIGVFTSERAALKCEDGVSRNMNHDKYSTQIVEINEVTA